MSTPQFRTEEERQAALTPQEKEAIFALEPTYELIEEAAYFDNDDLPCPIRVDLQMGGHRESLVLRRHEPERLIHEIVVLRALRRFGLPVPDVLSEPFDNGEGRHTTIYSLLPGENLQKLSMSSAEGLDQAKELLIEGVRQLSSATDYLTEQPEAEQIPRISLADELEALKTDNPWLEESFCTDTIRFIQCRLDDISQPLVFTNGDYQPGNFLCVEGEICGLVDFESASFQDPLMGFAKYTIDDLHPLSKAGMVDAFLTSRGFDDTDFAWRLAIGCLKTLKREIPVSGGEGEYRGRLLGLLDQSLSAAKNAKA